MTQEKTEEAEVQQESSATPEARKKKGFTISESVLALLKTTCQATGHGQSKVVEATLRFSLPVYGENGFEGLQIIHATDAKAYMDENVPLMAVEEAPIEAQFTEPVPTHHGKREKLQIADLPGKLPGYRPNLGETLGETLGELPARPQPSHTAMMGEQGAGLSEANLSYIVQQLVVKLNQPIPEQHIPGPPPGYTPGYAAPPGAASVQQPQVPQQPPVPPVQFAASYPPGYTGSPGVGPVQQPQPQGMYPFPQTQQQVQPAYMNDPYAVNIAEQVAQNTQRQPLSAQGLLSGAQNITPNVAQPNINLKAPQTALGPNWRQNLRRLTTESRREEPLAVPPGGIPV
jgi:hypothetical protein